MPRNPIWTAKRQWAGNLIPIASGAGIFSLVLPWQSSSGWNMTATTLSIIIAASVMWLTMRFFGLFQNNMIRRELANFLKCDADESTIFVGYRTKKTRSAIDPHGDVAFLCINPYSLQIFGVIESHEIIRQEVESIQFRANAHTLVGLGGFVRIQTPTTWVDLEVRSSSDLLNNYRETRRLISRLQKWHRS